MPPKTIDSLAFLRMVAALCLVRLSLFGEDDGVSRDVVGDLDNFICGEVSGVSIPKAELCGVTISIFGDARGPRVGDFSEGA